MSRLKNGWFKLLAIALTLVLIVPILAACGGGSEELTDNPTLLPTKTTTPALTQTAIHTPTTTATQTPTPTPPPEKPQFISDDGQIEGVIDQIYRTRDWPAEIRDARTPQQEHNFVVVHVTIVKITSGHFDISRGSTIIDNNGREYLEDAYTWKGSNFCDPHDITSGHELVEGAQGTYIFELPEQVQPVTLKLACQFFESFSESCQPVSVQDLYMDITLQ